MRKRVTREVDGVSLVLSARGTRRPECPAKVRAMCAQTKRTPIMRPL